MAEQKECWGYSVERQPERWIGMCDSREAAIAEAIIELRADVFYIHQGYRPNAIDFFPDANEILELAGERAYDEAGEAAEEFPDVADEPACAELDAFIRAWIEKHGITCGFWISDGEPERIDRFAHVSARAHCGQDPSTIGACGGTDDTCSCECTSCQDPNA